MSNALNPVVSRSVRWLLLSCGLAAAVAIVACPAASAQPLDEGAEDPAMETRVFSVADLVLPAPDYSFQGIDVSVGPGGRTSFGPSAGVPGGYSTGGLGGGAYGGGGFGGGGFGGGGLGGGFFQVAGAEMGGGGMGGLGAGGMGGFPSQPQPESAIRRFGMRDLIEVILTTVEPQSWESVGGAGSIATLGTMLVVRQSKDVLDQVEALLMSIRETGGTLQSVTIRADWLLIEPGQLAGIMAGEGGAINREAVRSLVASSGASGQITCFDGQTVHIVAGKLQTGVTSVVPVVGQHSPEEHAPEAGGLQVPPHVLAQQSEDAGMAGASGGMAAGGYGAMPGTFISGRSVGYQPVMQSTNLGALLQVTPTVAPGGESIVLDLRSRVARQAGQPGQPIDFRGVVPLDRLNVIVQQFMTTLHLPLGEPRLIAGSTLEPFAQGEDAKQLYLFVEATLPPRP